MPTKAPELPHGALFKRDFSSICGYVDGVSANSLDCGSAICGFNTYSSAFGCCSSTYVSAGGTYAADCAFYTSCRDYTEGCDATCQSNTAVEFCGSDYPYCAPLTYSSSFGNYFCASVTAGTAPQPVLASWIYGVNSSSQSVAPVTTSSAPTESGSSVGSTTPSSSYSAGSANNGVAASPSPTPFSQSQQFGYATASGSIASTTSTPSSGTSLGVADGTLRFIGLITVAVGALAVIL
ncbi:hypothetical protein B0A55_00220 [Friedmanniomyces simplex]|uniref:Uncharacterized protein n=1 Tax=Friedmanniomyces simplex TaxID=329884 RepID=A0A4U0Y0J9_9PEZI|nr:hypothetical protein B0A55_00220 [Friedmanniomyces simplex]